MKKAFLILTAAVCLSGCGPGNPEDAKFKGTWKHVSENALTSAKSELLVHVITDGKKFRITEETSESSFINVYDGKMLHTQSRWKGMSESSREHEEAGSEDSAESGRSASMPETTSKAVQAYEVGSHRFWNDVPRGQSKPGGLIANRDSVLYQIAERRPDGELDLQLWIDAKTGVTLKRIMTIYSSQVRSIVTQETWECQSITYEEADRSAYQKP